MNEFLRRLDWKFLGRSISFFVRFSLGDPPGRIHSSSGFLAFLSLLLGGILFSVSAQAAAKDLSQLSVEELMKVEIVSVQGASKYEQKITEAPSVVTLISADQIKKYGYRTLADILRSVGGLYVTYDRTYGYLGFRGFGRPGDYNTRILLLIDGHRINDNIYNSAMIGTEFILDVDLIERVEIIRGPSSSIYGSNAFFGVINIITRKGRALKGFETSGEIEGYQTYKGRLTYGGKYSNGVELLLSGTAYESKGDKSLFYREYASPQTNNGFAENTDGDRSSSLFSNLSYGDFSLQGAYISRDKGIPTASYGTDFNDPRNQVTDQGWYLDAKYEHIFADDFDVRARLFYDDYDYHGVYIFSSVVNQDFAWGKAAGGEFSLTNTSLDKNKITLGAEYRNNLRQDQSNYDEVPYRLALEDKRKSEIWALYLQDEFRIRENLLLNVGVRYDHYSTFGDTTNPRLALIYSPFEKTTFKLLYGQAFRPPNVYEFYYHDSGFTMKANPNLKPEKIRTYEIACEQYLGSHLRGTLSLFYYKIENLIDQVEDPADGLLVFQNVGKVESKGVDFEIEGRWGKGWEARFSYTYQESENSDTKTTLTNSPQHLAKLNWIAPLYADKVFSGIEFQYTGKRKTISGNKVDDFLLVNLTLFSHKFLKGLEASASIYNLFNRKYSDPAGVEHLQDFLSQDGTNFRFKVTYTF